MMMTGKQLKVKLLELKLSLMTTVANLVLEERVTLAYANTNYVG